MEIRPEHLTLIMLALTLVGLLMTSRSATRASAADIAKLQVSIDNVQREMGGVQRELAALRDNNQGVQASIVHITGLAEHNREEIKILRERVRSIELERKVKHGEEN